MHVSHVQRTSVGQTFWNSVSDVCMDSYWKEGSTGCCWWGIGMGWGSLWDSSPSTPSSGAAVTAYVHSHTKCGHSWFWPDQFRKHPAGLIFALLSKATQWIKKAFFNPKRYWVIRNLPGKCRDTHRHSSSRKIKEANMCNQIIGNHFLSHLPESSRIGASGPSLGINTWNKNWLMIRNMCET